MKHPILVIRKSQKLEDLEYQRVYIGRPSIFGNPYTHIVDKHTLAKYVVESREVAVQQYLEYARAQWRTNVQFRDALTALIKIYQKGGKIALECWCAPKKCHGEIIRDIIYKLSNA